MNYLKKAAVCMTAAAMFAANSVGFMPYESIELPAITANAAVIVSSGECGANGDNVNWELDWEGTLTISGEGAISYQRNFSLLDITKVIIKNGVTEIKDNVFWDCSSITSITIPDSVKSIGYSAFKNCKALEEVTIPDSVTSIGFSAFENCKALEEVIIPDSVKSIGYSAFRDCSSLKVITIPDGVTSIPASLFSGCSSLESITIPDGVTSISTSSFSDCSLLESITIPDSVTNIGEDAFESTPWLDNKRKENPFVIVNNILIDGENCVGDIIIPDDVTNIIEGAFSDCSNLNSIVIPNSVVNIVSRAFSDCSNLTSITISDSITSIGSFAFSNCPKLTSIVIPESVTNIGYAAFEGTPWLEAKQKENPCVIVNGILIDGYLCEGSVNIPDSVTIIGCGAFFQNPKITSVTIPEGVTSIEEFAFGSCFTLKTVEISKSVTSISGDSFMNTPWLGAKQEENPLVIVNGILIDGCACDGDVIIPENVTSIANFAFGDFANPTSITIENPKCEIYDDESTISDTATIYGYTGSTAQEYAEKYNRTFIALDESSETTPVTTAVTTATKAATTTTTTKAKPVTTTVKTTALYPLTKVVTTTNSIHVDYAPELEYDDSPMKVGETRAIYISDPTGKPVEDIKIMLMNDKISSSYEKGSNVLYITAVKPGKGSISLMIPGGSLTNGASFEIVEDTTVLTTTTVKATTVVTTTATTTAPTPDVILGDVDNNGIMDMSDASYIMAHYNAVACGQESPLNEAQQKAADTNGDGCINSYDAFIVSKIYAAIMTGMDVSDVPAYIAENFTYKCVDSADGGYTVEEIAASSVKPTLSVADVEYKLDELAENGYIAEVTLSAEGFDEDVTAFDFHVYYDEGLTPYYTENNGYKNLKVSTMGGAAYCSLGKGFNEADNYIFISLVNRQKENLNGEMIKLYFNVPKDAQSGDKFKVYPEYTKGDVLVSGADNKSHAYLFTQGLKGGTLSIKGDAVTTTVTTTKATTITTTTATTTIPTTTEPVTTALRVVSTDCKITIDTLPTKTIYNVGEELDLDGGKISIFADVTFTDGENVHGERIDADMSRKNHIQVKHPTGSYIVPFVIKADTSAVDMSVPGEYPVIVKILDATENIVYTSETFNITVKEAATTTTTTPTTTTSTVTTTTTSPTTTTSTATTTTPPTTTTSTAATTIATTTTTTSTAPTTTTPPTTTEPYFVIGDVNEDGKVDSADASLVLAEYALIQTGGDLTFTEKQKNAADVNKDGKTDSSDASKILEYYAAISTGKDPSWE